MAKKYPQYIIDKAIELRVKNKLTVPEIAERMGVAKSTVDSWMKDYPLEKRTEKQTKHQKRAAEANRERAAAKRDIAYAEGWEQAPVLFNDVYFRDFINMYLGEGGKKDRSKIVIANSDVTVLQLSHYWMLKFKNPDNAMYYSVQIHEDHDEAEIKEYWAKALSITPEMVNITHKSNSGKLSGRQFRTRYGVFSIQASDTYFHSKMQAWLTYLRKQWVDKFGNQ
jgi:transcriptional regulator with XRE-family HTH domain